MSVDFAIGHTKPSYMELVDGFLSFMKAHNAENLNDTLRFYFEGKKHILSFSSGEYPHKDALVTLCHAISPYIADMSKADAGGLRTLMRSVRQSLKDVKSFVLDPDDYEQFLVVLYADATTTQYKMSSGGLRESAVQYLVEVHDFLHAHCNRLYTHDIGISIVKLLAEYLASVGKFQEAYLITRECACRTRDADWCNACGCKDKPWLGMFKLAAGYAIQWRKARLEKEERETAHSRIVDAEAEAARLVETSRRHRAEKSREERAAEEELARLKLVDLMVASPSKPSKSGVLERMQPVISKVHRMPKQKEARQKAFNDNQLKTAAEAAKARAQKAKDQKKKNDIDAQRAAPAPPLPTLRDYVPIE